jgi:carboxyl-terminal processing protease
MPRDPFVFVFSPHHEPSDVLQKHQWDLALCAQLDEVRALLSGLRKQNPIVRNDADRPQAAPQAAPPPLPPLGVPQSVEDRVSRLPAEGAPAFDATRPETDHQLQQAVQFLRNLAAVPGQPQRRVQR